MKKIEDYLHLYLGCEVYIFTDESLTDGFLEKYLRDYPNGGRGRYTLTLENLKRTVHDGYKPLLRPLSDMTEEEMIGLLQSMVPADMEDKPTDADYDLEMFYNDGGLMVDGDVAVGANYTCICYEGQIAVRDTGDIHLFDEAGKIERLVNQPQAFRYLLSKSFDLFNLIPEGLAIDKSKLALNETTHL